MIQLLLENGSRSILNKCDGFGRTPLRIACSQSSPEVVQYLLENGADIQNEGCLLLTALNHKCRSYIHRIISMLLDYGADVNQCSSRGTTPLLMAVERASYTKESSFFYVCELIKEERSGCERNQLKWTIPSSHGGNFESRKFGQNAS
ncbi:ankyrin repeat family A protein 2-like [Stegodyphus dumicola]|uniref:ankyrin repeat family A protein 2-like n=1 Tax=Stegodyphus dumicola TaxID=202533 RepID=UPI0015AF2D94|nr:ankyrin repeat family A protein 2-like [Stegodyphus dumicola]